MFLPLTVVRSDRNVAAPCVGNVFLFYSCAINVVPSVRESSPKGNYYGLFNRNGGRRSGVSRLRVLIG